MKCMKSHYIWWAIIYGLCKHNIKFQILPAFFINRKDKTNKGHDLGSPENRVTAFSERNLSASAVCIVRALMHSSFIWSFCSSTKHQLSIASLISPRVQHLPEFFWQHLEKDIDLLCANIQRGIEDVMMIIHLVLGHILTINPPIGNRLVIL